MKELGRLITTILTILMVLTIFLLADVVFVGLISLVAAIFSKAVALHLLEYGVTILLIIEIILTIPAAIKSCNEGDDESGA